MTENKCFKCANQSNHAFLVQGELEGKKVFVCVQCLPSVIHGNVKPGCESHSH